MRRAIALIELIFAMVVIAITLISVPNLISKTTKASNEAINQEAISNAASFLDMAMSSYWDEECVPPNRKNPILIVEKEDNALKEFNMTFPTIFIKLARRVGSPITTSRKFIDANGTRYKATSPNNLGMELGESEPDDIDDFNGRATQLIKTNENTTAQEGDYKDKKITLSTVVNYIDDTPNPSGYNMPIINFDNPFSNIENIKSTNIKAITVTLTSQNDNKKSVVLRAFSCNIGSSKLKEKQF